MSSSADVSGSESALLEGVIRRFEWEWRHGPRPDLTAFLPASGERRVRLLVELAHIDLEFRLAAGEPARAADYLARFPELRDHPTAAGELILTEYRLLERAGRAVQPTAFLDGYPDHRTALMGGLSGAGSTRTPGPRPADVPAFTPAIDGLEIQCELGRGGMGVVFLAYQPSLNRMVAVKTLRAGPAATASERGRFQREAEAIARLDHPHIVPIYKVGEWSLPGSAVAVPYFVMKYYSGGSLEAAPSADSFAAVAARVETVARAVDHAHRRGVLHRDLKPSNILLDDGGQPHVADLGLASVYDAEASAAASTATVVGTPAYMAPEQATAPGQVTVAADVYGLGAVLYQLLTGRPPFHGDGPLAVLRRVASVPPVRPREVRPDVPRDLETICLKCLEKEPGKRYATAADLAADLKRWRAGEPIVARPASELERLWRLVRRHPLMTSAALTAVAAQVSAVVVLVVANARISEKERQTADALCQEMKAREEKDQALQQVQELLAVERVASAGRFWQANQIPQARQLLDDCPPRLRRWEWFHLDAVLRDGHDHPPNRELAPLTGPVGGVVVSPDGKLAAVTVTVTAAALNPKDHEVRVFDADSGAVRHTLPGAKAAVFAPDSARLYAVGPDGGVALYRLADGAAVRRWRLPGEFASRLALSPDGGRLAVGTADGMVTVLDTGSEAVPPPLLSDLGIVESLAFHPTEHKLVISARARTLMWDLTRNAAEFGFPGAKGARAIAFAPNGRWLAAVDTDRTVRRYDATTGEVIGLIAGSVPRILGMAVHPDASRLATYTADGAVTVWDIPTGRDVLTFPGTDHPLGAVAWDGEGRRLFAADSALRVRSGAVPVPTSAR